MQSQKENGFLERAKIWGELIPFCEEMEREGKNEAKAGWTNQDLRAPSLKSPKIKRPKTGFYDHKAMTRAAARDLGLI